MNQRSDRWLDPLTSDYTGAVVVGFLFVALPILAYTEYRSIFGELAELKLVIFCALGMAVAFSLFFGAGRRLLAFIPGMVTGLVAGALVLYASSLLAEVWSTMPTRWVLALLFIVALFPGLLLYWLLRMRGESDAL
ncbi:MAG: hypothetical protein KIT60_12190 [Burkholderiaceae bacterium]|nr:hypothetical protein [Burkholderiaceae bacterium]